MISAAVAVKKTCGDFGGRTKTNEWCKISIGLDSNGRCHRHRINGAATPAASVVSGAPSGAPSAINVYATHANVSAGMPAMPVPHAHPYGGAVAPAMSMHPAPTAVPAVAVTAPAPEGTCPVVLSSGTNKGQLCGRPAKYGTRCGLHKPKYKGESSSATSCVSGATSGMSGMPVMPNMPTVQATMSVPASSPALAGVTCTTVMESGPNKGQACGKLATYGKYCGKHWEPEYMGLAEESSSATSCVSAPYVAAPAAAPYVAAPAAAPYVAAPAAAPYVAAPAAAPYAPYVPDDDAFGATSAVSGMSGMPSMPAAASGVTTSVMQVSDISSLARQVDNMSIAKKDPAKYFQTTNPDGTPVIRQGVWMYTGTVPAPPGHAGCEYVKSTGVRCGKKNLLKFKHIVNGNIRIVPHCDRITHSEQSPEERAMRIAIGAQKPEKGMKCNDRYLSSD
jgi:hypothetical protein